ncbi:hypothetical protein [Kitasatospora griseola]|uniref:hypothetical protein n=1 Tax=Kitasatospora griseola TaxID=2064 RepID=UPI0016708CAF|nr:hypothetical protein [Kitasatospora griseola]GGR02392.1 hypothetical protein GCM10010195_67620 [Kitasatospora griseola]
MFGATKDEDEGLPQAAALAELRAIPADHTEPVTHRHPRHHPHPGPHDPGDGTPTLTARANAFGASLTTGPTPPDHWALDLKISGAGHRPSKE